MMNLDELYYKYYSNHIEKQYSNNTRIKLVPLTDQTLNVYLDNLIEYRGYRGLIASDLPLEIARIIGEYETN